jgi:DNA-binding IclR family transcriptional regulator
MSRKSYSMSRNEQVGVVSEKADGRYLVQPVLRAMDVLQLVCRSPEPIGLNSVVKATKLPKTTVFRYLRTLENRRLIEHDEGTDCYRPGIGLWWLTNASNPYETLKRLCRPAMKGLQSRFNETVNLGVLYGNEVMYLDIIESDWSLRMRAGIGSIDPIHSTALGKALVAFRPKFHREMLIPRSLSALTKHTIVDRDALLEQLDIIRATGYAIEVGENEEGSCCVAAPIRDESDFAVAALSVSGPVARMDDVVRQAICAQLITACGDLGRELHLLSSSK